MMEHLICTYYYFLVCSLAIMEGGIVYENRLLNQCHYAPKCLITSLVIHLIEVM